MNKLIVPSLLLLLLIMSSCQKDNNGNGTVNIDVPENYTFERNGVSTVAYDGQTTRIAMATELSDGLRDFDKTSEQLLEMYANQSSTGADVDPYADATLNNSTKSIKSKVAASYDYFDANTVQSAQIKADIETWIMAQVEQIFPYENELAEEGKPGQIADGSSARYIDAKGVEYDQVVTKSLIGALMLDQICNNYLSISVLDAGDNRSENDLGITEDDAAYTTMEHKWDEAYGYLFGLSIDGSNPLTNLGEDIFLNKYLTRVEEDDDFSGIALTIFNAFKLGRAAIVAGEYDVRDAQAEIIREQLSKLIGIRSVYYLQQGKLALENSDFGGAFHDLSEGFGFIYSLQFTRQKNTISPYFTKDEVDGYLSILLQENGFWNVTSESLDFLSEEIAARFDFTVTQASN